MKKYTFFVLSILALFGSAVFLLTADTEAKQKEMTVYASPACGCCHKWVKHLESNGLKVKTIMMDDVYKIKEKYKIPDNLQSCHTGIIDGYVVEGHVPYAAVNKLLTTKPSVKGIAVPGMPIGSPGMEQGNEKEKYNVMSFGNGKDSVFMKF